MTDIKDILDHEKKEVLISGTKFRPLAIALEAIPFFGMIAGILFSTSMVIISSCVLSFIYLGLGWYLFKGGKFTAGTIIYAIFSGIVLSIGILALLFTVMRWEGVAEMSIVAYTLMAPLFLFSVVWYFLRKDKYFEFTLSLKIIARLAIISLILLIS